MFTFWTSLWSLNIIPKLILHICIFEFPNFGKRLYKHHNHIIQFISCNCESREIYFIWFITLSRWGWIPITFFFFGGGSTFKTLPLVMKTKVPAVFELGTCRSVVRSYNHCTTVIDTVNVVMLSQHFMKSWNQGVSRIVNG